MIQTCWVSTLPSFLTENESRIDIYVRFQIRIPQGGPWRSRDPLGRTPKYLINIRHVGYQFYSVFSTENKSRVDTSLGFQIRLPLGGGSPKVVVRLKIAPFSSSKAGIKLVARLRWRPTLRGPMDPHGQPCGSLI